MKRWKNEGFTLIELMIVVAVLSIIAMIAIPKMSDLIRKGNEAGTRGNLGSVRGALHIYFLDNDETYPADITAVLSPGSKYYSGSSPVVFTTEHGKRLNVNQVPDVDPLVDVGEWGYVSGGANKGSFWIQCTHPDLNGKAWSQY